MDLDWESDCPSDLDLEILSMSSYSGIIILLELKPTIEVQSRLKPLLANARFSFSA